MKMRLLQKGVCLMAAFLMTLITSADNLTVGGQQRTYNVYAPKNLGANRPLLIFCHGYNQDANWMQNSEFKNDNVSMEAVCDTARFVVVFPNGIGKSWDISGDRDINFIKAIIDKMATQHNIDRNRVYLGGFSMGGMLTYHAMNRIPDLIAAFCPVSGYPMGGASAVASVRAIPILHIHGTGDNTCSFSGVQPALNVWIKHNGCPTTDRVLNNYNGFSGAKMHRWGPGNDGVEVRLLELPNKGHWICKETQVYTGKEIWNFCRNFSLNNTKPHVTITSPKAGYNYTSFAPAGSNTFSDMTFKATANDPNGQVERVDFYDGTQLVGSVTSAPYQVTLKGLTAGKHLLKVIAIDNDGETATASVELNLVNPQTLNLSKSFKESNALPAGWTTFDSSERRVGYAGGFGTGCRVLQFTAASRGLDYGLYIRNINGNEHQGWAKYGLSDSGTKLSLAPGTYSLKYKICNWNNAGFNPVELSIERLNGTQTVSVAQQTYTPDVNIGNKVDNKFGAIAQQVCHFSIAEQGDYAIAVYTAAAAWADCIIGQLELTADSYITTGIGTTMQAESSTGIYDLQGRRYAYQPRKGFYIKNGKLFVQ